MNINLTFGDEEKRNDEQLLAVCRVCLITQVKMFNLQSYPLDSYFGAITGIPVISTMDLPMYLCFECAFLVKKFSLFKDRCLRGQSILYNILQNNGSITEQDLNKIDRQKSQTASNYGTSNISIYDVSENQFHEVERNVLEQKIKEEPTEQNVIEVSVDLECVKDEDYLLDGGLSDDEPLSLHKTKKKVKKKKKEVVENKAVEAEKSKDSETEVTLPRKRGRPRKYKLETPTKARRTRYTGGVQIDDFDLHEHVTVSILTLEEQLEEINQRKDSDNYKNAAFQCNKCYKGFIDVKAWNHHLRKHDPSAGDVECAVCKFRFQTKRLLQKHVINHEKKYACKSCTYVSKSITQAKQHQRWHRGVTYMCEYCDEVSTKWTSYLSHVRIKHPSQHICGACGYSFVSALGLAMHRTMMHKEKTEANDDESAPFCQECNVKFVSWEAYNRHMVTSVKHTLGNNFGCGCRVCGAKFSNAEELRLHNRKEHARIRPKNYGKKQTKTWPAKCEHCSEEISNGRDHWSHYRREHPDKPYPIEKNHVCDVCGKSFRGNAFLTYHKRTHSELRPFSCATCGKSFFNRTNLATHVRTHSDLRPYPCDVCFKTFKCKAALDRHYRSHTGVKPYECEVCGKAFSQSNSRKLHVRTVHLKQPAPYVSKTRMEKRKPTKEPTVPFTY